MSTFKIADGQVPLFFEEPPPEVAAPIAGPAAPREETSARAGTVLNHKWCHDIYVMKGRSRRRHGLYDESQRIYQTGGEMSMFIYWKAKLVSIDYDVWLQIAGKVDWIEIIDHEKNECWRISMKKVMKTSTTYDAGIGKRLGVPMEYWHVIRADNTYRIKGRELP